MKKIKADQLVEVLKDMRNGLLILVNEVEDVDFEGASLSYVKEKASLLVSTIQDFMRVLTHISSRKREKSDVIKFDRKREEETHSVCQKHFAGGKSVCCECSGKTDCLISRAIL